MASEQVDVATAREMWQAGDVFLDVREPEEYAAGHVSGALNEPIGLLATRLDRLPAGQIVTLCSMGGRAGRAAAQLDSLGRIAVSLSGGTKAWQAAGLPITRGSEPGPRRVSRR